MKYTITHNNIVVNNIYLILDKIGLTYIYILYKENKIYKFFYILNYIYIFFIYNLNLILYLIPKLYKYTYYNLNKNFNINRQYKLILHIIGINYKFYYLHKYNILIFQLKYNHKIIIKLPKLINCELNILKHLIYLYSDDLCLLNMIGKLISFLQYKTKYKEVGIYIIN